MIRPKQREKKSGEKHNRLKLVLAVILLLALSVIARLYNLEVSQYDMYAAMAAGQHNMSGELAPKRGRVFLQEREGENGLYAAATNKDFALVYAVPKEIQDSKSAGELFYEVLDKARVEKEVDDILSAERSAQKPESDEEGGFNPLIAQSASGPEEEALKEYWQIKREAEIKLRKEKILQGYEEKLNKPEDPYEPIKKKVAEEDLKKIMDKNLAGVKYLMEDFRYYPEKEVGSHILGFVGQDGDKRAGRYGLEGFFDSELSGSYGSIRTERGAGGGLIIVNDRIYSQPQNGSDLVLTINHSIQFAACNKLRDAVMRHGADGGSVVVLDPGTGAIIAMCSYPDYDPNEYGYVSKINVFNNPAIFNQWEPGSIFKPLTIAAALDRGKITPETTYEDKGFVMIEGWPKPIKNSDFSTKGGRGRVNMVRVLEDSLNTGVVYVMDRIGSDVFAEYVKNFGFGEKTGIELETESSGNIKALLAKKIRPVEAATASFGQGITATPLQMANAFAAIANNGILMKPHLVKEIRKSGGDVSVTQPRMIRRVISERSAALLGGMLVKVVENGHGKRAGVPGYYIAGKTGTAQVPKKGGGYEENAHIGSFAGFGPVDDPVFAMLVKIDNPRDVEWAESSAAPLFGEIAQFILNYYKIPKER